LLSSFERGSSISADDQNDQIHLEKFPYDVFRSQYPFPNQSTHYN
jgi:hypothetical protein